MHLERKEKEKEKEWEEIVHLHRMHRVHPTPRIRLSTFVERTEPPQPRSACHYLIFIHSAHCFWITGCPPLHSSSLIFPHDRPTGPTGRDLLRHRNTFRKPSCKPLCFASKDGFHCNFHFCVARRNAMHLARHQKLSFVYLFSFFLIVFFNFLETNVYLCIIF